MSSIAKKVQLSDPEDSNVLWYPITTAETVLMGTSGELLINEIAKYMRFTDFAEEIGGVKYIKEAAIPNLSKYLKRGNYSTTDYPYVQEVSVNTDGNKLIVKTWSKESNGVIKQDEIDIVGENTTYTISAIRNTSTSDTPNSAIRLSGNDGSIQNILIPTGTLRDDDNVELVLNGNFYGTP